MAVDGHASDSVGVDLENSEFSDDERYVVPDSYLEILHDLNLYVKYGKPVLLTGAVGCGKSAFLRHVARLAGRSRVPELITIQLCKDIDGKSLLGSYHCTEVAGEFKWLPGLLTTAVRNSSWVILEDLDCAPPDVVSILLPLIQKRKLEVIELGKTFTAEESFRIFATLRTTDSVSRIVNTDLLISSHFKRLHLKQLNYGEILNIASVIFHGLNVLFPRLVAIFEKITRTSDMDFNLRRMLAGRSFSLRDFLKLCRRINRYFQPSSMSQSNDIFKDVFICFCAFIPDPDLRFLLSKDLGALLHVSNPEVAIILKHEPVIKDSDMIFSVGRAQVPKLPQVVSGHENRDIFTLHPSAARLLENLASSVLNREACLLVGETGTGKTSVVQFLAKRLNCSLHVLNLSHQSESCDLLGGYKPVDSRLIISSLRDPFLELFSQTFSKRENEEFVSKFLTQFSPKNWELLAKTMRLITKTALKKAEKSQDSSQSTSNLRIKWSAFSDELSVVEKQMNVNQRSMLFSFLEGTLVKAYRSGDWVLLDEVNLANPELLSSLHNFVDRNSSSFVLTDRGSSEVVERHQDFRLFACMNPATDIGKRDLPSNIRDRFTEFYCDELSDPIEVRMLVLDYLDALALEQSLTQKIVELYFKLRELADTKLIDGVSHKPYYSLRTYTQALKFAARNTMGNMLRSLYEGFCLSYLTQLNRQSQVLMRTTIASHLLGTNAATLLKRPAPEPTAGKWVNVEGYWLPCGSSQSFADTKYITTKTVKNNLAEIARAVSAGQLPVLLQGETSIGKTSMIAFLAKLTGNSCVRINNHEHTDLEDYLGSYHTNEAGKLVFQEGILVNAVRKGHWIILDELNLAPSDVLEALNRLLDANRELFICETQTVVKAHPNFMLFATQNPPGYYGGRKTLSRAFRNRFIEMHFDEIPPDELQEILQKRCDLPQTKAQKMIAVMLELQALRRKSGVFAGKQGFITLRDLFRWADRYRLSASPQKGDFHDFDQHLADHGFLLLSGRVRKVEETDIIKRTLEKHFKRTINVKRLFEEGDILSSTNENVLKSFMTCDHREFRHIVWTSNMKRLAVLAGNALAFGEPVLLVGETGCGKTTMCQIYALLKQLKLFTVNCHINTETSDFLGGLRPVRNQEDSGKLFEWKDGSLIEAMRDGAVFLLDEISLAEDSVIERVNSVLEPERSLVLTEKGCAAGTQNVEEIIAHPTFRFVATMNPGGDFGKKELSPALRNRFTEIWCNNLEVPGDAELVCRHNLFDNTPFADNQEMKETFVLAMKDFIVWHEKSFPRILITSRDLISWIRFINHYCRSGNSSADVVAFTAYFHGTLMVFETLNLRDTTNGSTRGSSEILHYLINQAQTAHFSVYFSKYPSCGVDFCEQVIDTEYAFGVEPFSMQKSLPVVSRTKYSFESKSVRHNLLRILRGLTVAKAVLLEGSPGVGKTSIVCALAAVIGHKVVRINLSEQTDVSELFGADMPTEGENALFSWRDGPFLQALKEGSWILLDELNLASQSVLEGLNACLDHRGEIYIPELGKSFKVDSDKTRIFACQNPLHQGAGRKGLPKSFLNRFTQVYMEVLSDEDLLVICSKAFPTIPSSELGKILCFNGEIQKQILSRQLGNEGQPWEFNLRDVMRLCELLISVPPDSEKLKSIFIELLYVYRFRTAADQNKVRQIAMQFLSLPQIFLSPRDFVNIEICRRSIKIGVANVILSHVVPSEYISSQLLQSQSAILEKLLLSVQHNFVSILVGSQGSGKTTLVESLAALTGNRLDVMNMNTSTDAGELLGGFEQWSNERRVADIVETCARLVAAAQEMDDEFKQLLLNLVEFKEHQDFFRSSCQQLLIQLQMSFTDWMSQRVYSIDRLKHQLKRYLNSDNFGKGSFEWSDSIIVKALVEGSWLLIENANLCSPAVLDRLNSVLEPGGQLVLSERGALNGAVPVIKAHRNFRLFLTTNPKYGELSRAMRNRAIELFILPPFHSRDNLALLQDFRFPEETVLTLKEAFDAINKNQKITLRDIHEIALEMSMRVASNHLNSIPNDILVLRKVVERCSNLEFTEELIGQISQILKSPPVACGTVLPFPVTIHRLLDNGVLINTLRHQNSLISVWLNLDTNLKVAASSSVPEKSCLLGALILPVMVAPLEIYLILSTSEEWTSRTSMEFVKKYKLTQAIHLAMTKFDPVFKLFSDVPNLCQGNTMDINGFPSDFHVWQNWVRVCVEWSLKFFVTDDYASKPFPTYLHQLCDFFMDFQQHVFDLLTKNGPSTFGGNFPNSFTNSIAAALWLRSLHFVILEHLGSDSSFLAIIWYFFMKQVWTRFPDGLIQTLLRRKSRYDLDFHLERSKITSKLRRRIPSSEPFRDEDTYRKFIAILEFDLKNAAEDALPEVAVRSLEKSLQSLYPVLVRKTLNNEQFGLISKFWRLYHLGLCLNDSSLSPLVLTSQTMKNPQRAILNIILNNHHALPMATREMLLSVGLPQDLHSLNSLEYFSLLCSVSLNVPQSEQDPSKRLSGLSVDVFSWNQEVSSFLGRNVLGKAVSLDKLDEERMALEQLRRILWRVSANAFCPEKRERLLLQRISEILIGASSSVFPETALSTDVGAIHFFSKICQILPSDHKLATLEKRFFDTWLTISDCEKVMVKTDDVAAEWIFSGFATLKMFFPPLVDPVQKAQIKRDCLLYQASECRGTLQSVSDYFTVLYGSPDERNYDSSIISFHNSHLQTTRHALTLGNSTVTIYRPQPSMYPALIQDAAYIHESVLLRATESIELFKHQNQNAQELKNKLDNVTNWTESLTQILEEFRRKYLAYRDLTSSFVSGIHQVIHGFCLLGKSCSKKLLLMQLGLSDLSLTVTKQIPSLFEFGTPDSSSYFSVAESIWKNRTLVLKLMRPDVETSPIVEIELAVFVLNLSRLQPGSFESNSGFRFTCLIHSLFNRIAKLWTDLEFKRKLAEAEKQQLYKFANQSDADCFPTFQEAFDDLYQRIDESKQEPAKKEEKEFTEGMQADIVKLHQELLWKEKPADSERVFLDALKISSEIYFSSNGSFDMGCFSALQLLQTRASERNLNPDSSSSTEKLWSFYHDANVQRSQTCVPLLLNIKQRIAQLLEEWPSNPVLGEITLIVNRILSFDVIEPLAKFLAGLELLLTKCQNWEVKAHSGVSVEPQMKILSEKILEWRKLELSEWKNSLGRVRMEKARKSARWWPFLYTTVLECMESKSKERTDDLIRVLQSFIEVSNLGDFKSRLDILRAVGDHFALLNEVPDDTCRVLKHLHGYYIEFLPQVESKIEESLRPIETELKNFVKVIRWNSDVNYWSLKHTVDKVHRRVLEFIRKFGLVLDTRVELTLADQVLNSLLIKGNSNWIASKLPVGSSGLLPALPGLDNLPTFLQKTQTFVRRILRSINYPDKVRTLLDLAEQSELRHRELRVDPTGDLPKEKRKMALKVLVQRRRLAFTSLSKALKELGLSSRKGLTLISTKNVNESFTCPLIASECLMKHSELVRSCQTEYYQSLIKLDLFRKLSEKPNKSLPGNVLAAMRGYVEHLHRIILENVQQVSQVVMQIESLHNFLLSVKSNSLEMIETSSLTNAQCRELVGEAGEITSNISYVLDKYLLLKNCIPTRSETADDEELLNFLFGHSGNIDESGLEWQSIAGSLKKCADIARTMMTNFRKYESSSETPLIVSGFVDHELLCSTNTSFLEIHTELGKVSTSFPEKTRACLVGLCKQLEDFNVKCESQMKPVNCVDIEEVLSVPSAKMVKRLLRCIQDIVGRYKESPNWDRKVHSESDISCDKLLADQLLKSLSSDLNLLGLEKTLKTVRDFVRASLKVTPNARFSSYLLTTSSFVSAYFAVSDSLTESVMNNFQTCCRLLNVLLGIFSEHVKNGFGATEETEDELNQEGSTQFEEAEQAGLGAGEGAKDVSDQIESQDQLEDTRKEGQQQQEEPLKENLTDEEHGIEMDEDFEGAMHDITEEEEKSGGDSGEETENPDVDDQLGTVDENDKTEQLDDELWKDENDEDSADETEHEEQNNSEVDAKGKDDNKRQELAAGDSSANMDGTEEQLEDTPSDETEEPTGNPDNIDKKEQQDADQTEIPTSMEIDEEEENFESEEVKEGDTEDTNETEEQPDQDNSPAENPKDEEVAEETETPRLPEEDSIQQPSASTSDQNQADVGTDGVGLPERGPDDQSSGANNFDEIMDEEKESSTTENQSKFGITADSSGQNTSSSLPQNTAPRPDSIEKRNLEVSSCHKTAGDLNQSYRKRLKISRSQCSKTTDTRSEQKKTGAQLFEHVQDEKEQFDTQTIDAANKDEAIRNQLEKFQMDEEREQAMDVDQENTEPQVEPKIDPIHADIGTVKDEKSGSNQRSSKKIGDDEPEFLETSGDFLRTLGAIRESSSFFHTEMSVFDRSGPSEAEKENLRSEMVDEMATWSKRSFDSVEHERIALELWKKYELVTQSYSYEMCEQLRLVLEPTKKTKLKGDYRTGKRLNMRKVVAYVASNFRKDKIWMRRSLPNQRQYQVMIAVDDSSSMADNRTKELAFESLALMSNALSLLEVGELSICSFGERVDLLHPFNLPFSRQDGARVLTKFSFQQKKTNLAEMLNSISGVFGESRSRLIVASNVSQLLLIVSDGRGVFREGVEIVKKAVRALISTGVFTVFVILDNPGGPEQSSILDIRVPVFGAPGQPLELKSYMQDFPFPFYLVLQDVKQLPLTLCDAVRQWFELIASHD